MAGFEYEWWTVDITTEGGRCGCEFKGKNKENVIRQIEKEIEFTNSERNLSKGFMREPRIITVHWDTLELDRKGYARRY